MNDESPDPDYPIAIEFGLHDSRVHPYTGPNALTQALALWLKAAELAVKYPNAHQSDGPYMLTTGETLIHSVKRSGLCHWVKNMAAQEPQGGSRRLTYSLGNTVYCQDQGALDELKQRFVDYVKPLQASYIDNPDNASELSMLANNLTPADYPTYLHPFGGDSIYYVECRNKTMHLNEQRLGFVREFLKEKQWPPTT